MVDQVRQRASLRQAEKVELSGRRSWWQTSGLTYTSRIQAFRRMSISRNANSNTYLESGVVNVADIWKERYFSYP